MPSLSVCMMVQNAEKTLAIALTSLGNTYDELIIVDGGSTDKTCEIAAEYGATIIHSHWPGNHSQQRNVYLREVKTDWVFVLDSDEFIDQKTLDFLELLCQQGSPYQTDHFWIPRKWISPISGNHYISSFPHFPDPQHRIFKYNRNLYYEGKIHEMISGFSLESVFLDDLNIYHLDLFINSEEKRKEKVRKYMKGNPLDGAIHYYLPPTKNLSLTEWNQEDILPEVKTLLQHLLDSTVADSNSLSEDYIGLIPEEIKKEVSLEGTKPPAGTKPLSVHFFTIVLNGESFIRYHIDIFKELPFLWHWHIVEGVADLKHDTGWSKNLGSRIADEIHHNGHSNDSITEYLDEITQMYPENVTVYRKPEGLFWDSKLEMVNEPLVSSIREECLLWQIDTDELWTIDQICTVQQMFLNNPDKTAAFYWYSYFIGENLVISSRNCYAQNPQQEGLRTWRFKPGCVWVAYDPPTLVDPFLKGQFKDVAAVNPFSHEETEKLGLIFKHSIFSVMKCKICQSPSIPFSQGKVLDKYDINYFQCSHCGFVQTEEPFWLEEAYADAIASSDVGLVWRNNQFSPITNNILFKFFNLNGKFLDYGAGYGLFVRLMRDLGWDFYWYDKYCQNLFAKSFEAKIEQKIYELVTAFEVFEHFVNPLEEIEKILEFSDNILFSTELLPANNPKPDDWWYYALQEGQHIAIYTNKALSIIADKFHLNLYSNGSSLHLLTIKKLSPILFENTLRYGSPGSKKESLLTKDYLKVTNQPQELENNQKIIENTASNTESSTRVKNSKIAIDGVFFQLYKTGIARVWHSLLEEWAINGFAENIVVFDRSESAPKIPGINYVTIPPYDYSNTDADYQMLQEFCDQEGADLFISTYYTTPISTPSVFMAYDMIPEILGANFNEPMWREKHQAIAHASAYISISENTANDLVKCFPDIDSKVTVAHCGISSDFYPAPEEEIIWFKTKYGINKPYFLLVGAGSDYKNAVLFFQGFSQLYSKSGFDVICTGAGYLLGHEYRELAAGSIVHSLYLSDEELRAAYSGATALVYPSKYEGFGMPIAEALACGCPVITCANASIPEVAGEAAIYIKDDDIDAMNDALCEVQKLKVRNSLITQGLEQAKNFSWSKMADTISSALIKATLISFNLRDINLVVFPDWNQPEEVLYPELVSLIKALATHPNRSKMTLLIDHQNISDEDANLALSSVMMNLLMEEELELDDSVEIVLIGQLNSSQWSVLYSQLQGRIKLNAENQEAISSVGAEIIPIYDLYEI